MSYASFGKTHFGSFVCKYITHILLAYMLLMAKEQFLWEKNDLTAEQILLLRALIW